MHPRLWQNSHTRYECSLKAALPTIEGKGGGNKKVLVAVGKRL